MVGVDVGGIGVAVVFDGGVDGGDDSPDFPFDLVVVDGEVESGVQGESDEFDELCEFDVVGVAVAGEVCEFWGVFADSVAQ